MKEDHTNYIELQDTISKIPPCSVTLLRQLLHKYFLTLGFLETTTHNPERGHQQVTDACNLSALRNVPLSLTAENTLQSPRSQNKI